MSMNCLTAKEPGMKLSITSLFVVCTLILCGARVSRAQAQQGAATSQAVRTKINPKDGATMVYIPAGAYQAGDNDLLKYGSPWRYLESLPGYWIYKDLVTVEMYKKFCSATNRSMPPEPEFPAGN